MTGRSLRRDLSIGLGVGLLVLWFIAMVGAAFVVREELDEIYDSLMQETTGQLLSMSGETSVTRLPALTETLLTWSISDGTGIRFSNDANPDDFAASTPLGFSTSDGQRHFKRTSDGVTIDVASPIHERQEALSGVLIALLLPALILLPLSLAGIVWFTNRRLRPIAALSAEVGRRSSGDLRLLTTPDLPRELAPVRDEMNRLIAGLAATLEAEKAFSANAAHELRTPIAATLAHIQLLSNDATGPTKQRAMKAEAELKRVTRLADKLLQLARADNVQSDAPLIDVVPILQLIAMDFDVDVTPPDTPVYVRIDVDSYAMLVRNLIENAVLHGSDVGVELSANGDLCVTNAGPVVDEQMLSRLTRRFERAGSQAAGSGLGLAIVSAICRNAGFGLTLQSPRTGHRDGFQAMVSVPVATEYDIASGPLPQEPTV